jgi:uncharacterized protein YejL (UPF0352 family)
MPDHSPFVLWQATCIYLFFFGTMELEICKLNKYVKVGAPMNIRQLAKVLAVSALCCAPFISFADNKTTPAQQPAPFTDDQEFNMVYNLASSTLAHMLGELQSVSKEFKGYETVILLRASEALVLNIIMHSSSENNAEKLAQLFSENLLNSVHAVAQDTSKEPTEKVIKSISKINY